jgi:hypothetical protein
VLDDRAQRCQAVIFAVRASMLQQDMVCVHITVCDSALACLDGGPAAGPGMPDCSLALRALHWLVLSLPSTLSCSKSRGGLHVPRDRVNTVSTPRVGSGRSVSMGHRKMTSTVRGTER